MLALPIFPGRLQPSIVGANELNFRVRDGNGWTLAAISTNYIPSFEKESKQRKEDFSLLTAFFMISSIPHYKLKIKYFFNGDP